jgi:single-stranded-DNA-specific exonuclease
MSVVNTNERCTATNPAMERVWRVDHAAPPPALDAYPRLIARILTHRGINDAASARTFFTGDAAARTDPFLLPDMDAAVHRICAALASGERIAIYGDFDVDGITATAILTEGIRRLGGNVVSFIPNRFGDGYGVSESALERLREQDATLVITVDCGISAHAEIARAKSLGQDLIVLDHHEVGAELPDAVAVVDPKRSSSRYPTRDICSGALAFRLLEALYERCGRSLDSERYLDLVALATVCDMVPLVGENRDLVKAGLRAMARTSRPGLRALLRPRDPNDPVEPPDAETLGYRIGPRINASGRLADAGVALELLTTADGERAEQLAGELFELNRRRQEMLEQALALACGLADQESPGASALVIGHPNISRGIVGLVAARLTELYGKTAFVYEQGVEGCVGSARGIEGFDVVMALDRADDLLLRHGGHKAAGGFALGIAAAPALRERLCEATEEQLRAARPRKEVRIDAAAALPELNRGVLGYMQSFAPCGMGNPAPLIMSTGVDVIARRAVGQGRHLMLDLRHGPVRWRAFAFGRGASLDEFGNQIDIVYSVEKGNRGFGPRLRLVDWREPSNRPGVEP